MDTEPDKNLALLNSLHYLGMTPIPMRNRYGESSVLYNHKTKTLAPTDKQGIAYLEPGGIYTIELASPELAKMSQLGEESPAGKSFFKNAISRNSLGASKRLNIGILPKIHAEIRSPVKLQNENNRKSYIITGRGKSEKDFEACSPSKQQPPSKEKMGRKGKPIESGIFNKEKSYMEDIIDTNDEVVDINSTISKTPPICKSKISNSDIHNPLVGSTKGSSNDNISDNRKSAEKDLIFPSKSLSTLLSSMKKKANSVENDTLSINITDDSDSEIDLLEMLCKPPPLPAKIDESNRSDRKESFVGSLPEDIKKDNSSKVSTTDLMKRHHLSITDFRFQYFSVTSPTNSQPTLSDPKPLSNRTRPLSTLQIQKTLFRSNDQMSKIDEIFSGQLKTIVISNLEDYLVRIDEKNLYISEGLDTKILFEMNLQNTVAKVNRNNGNYEFTIFGPVSEVSFTAPSYSSMINWIAVINSVSSYISRDFKMPCNIDDMPLEIFENEYHALLYYIENSEFTCYEEAFSEKISNDEDGILLPWVSMSDADAIKYDIDSSPPANVNIIGITFDKLIEKTTDIYSIDDGLLYLTFYSFRCFTDAKTLLSKILSRMLTVFENDSLNWAPVIKLRAISFVVKWIMELWNVDFQREDMKPLLAKFFKSIDISFNNRLDNIYISMFANIKKILNDRFTNIQSLTITSNNESTILSKDKSEKKNAASSILDIDAEDLVFALTKKDEGGLRKISVVSLLLHLWESHKDQLVNNLLFPINDMVENFNQMSFWVATEICTQPEIKNRVKVVEKFIKIANYCLKLYNFNTTLAIVSGLNLISVSRLKATWELVEPKKMKQLHALEDIMSPLGNYKAYRTIYEERDQSKPNIPVLSLLLKDLLFANDGNPTYLNNLNDKSMRLINVTKLKSIYGRIRQFVDANQQRSYHFEKTASSIISEEYCSNLRALKEQALYKYSCLCEPKSGDDVLRLRAKWMQS